MSQKKWKVFSSLKILACFSIFSLNHLHAAYDEFLVIPDSIESTSSTGSNQIQVEIQEGKPKIFPGGHDEKYWAHDSKGNRYKLRLKNALSNYAEIGTSVFLDLIGAPNLTVKPILLKRGVNQIPTVEEAQKLSPDNRYMGLAGRDGNWFPGTIQKVTELREFKSSELSGQQLAELAAQLIVNHLMGNHDRYLGNGKDGSLGYDGKNFYTLAATQSFKSYPTDGKPAIHSGFGQASQIFKDSLGHLDFRERENFTRGLNDYLTRLEQIKQEDLTPVFGHYWSGIRRDREIKEQPYFNFWGELSRRIKEARADTSQFFDSLNLDPALIKKLNQPTGAKKIAVALPQLSMRGEVIPSAFEHTGSELLWSYYFQDRSEKRKQAESKWADELGLAREEVVAYLERNGSRKLSKEATQTEINQEKFPNYFAPTQHSEAEIQTAIDQAMSSVIFRLNTPYEIDGRVKDAGFAEHLVSKVQSIDPGSRVSLSGGVVRSLLGYLYEKVYQAKLKKPSLDTLTILRSIAKERKPVESISALGVGSDIDALITPSSEERSVEIKEIAEKVINSARIHLHLDNDRDVLVTSMIPFGDVNLYSEQMNRAMKNGGSTLDYLAFDLKDKKIHTPKEHPDILSQFINGQYDYIPGTNREDSESTTIRALRPRLEIPFLILTDSGQRQLLEELKKIEGKVESGELISQKAMEQFEKMARNARIAGAKNRIYESKDPIDQLTKKIVTNLKPDGKYVNIVPRFIRRDDPNRREKKRIPDELLLNKEEFKKTHTKDGKLFHGTPDVRNLFSMIRNGMVLSINTEDFSQGAGAAGPGGYSTKDIDTAQSYATSGVVVPIELKEKIEPLIVDWEKVKDTPFMKKVKELANSKKPKMHVFELLAQDYGVDIIINKYVIIQNSAIIKLPKNIKNIIGFQATSLIREPFNGSFSFRDRLRGYRQIYQFARALGYSDLIAPEQILIQIMKVHDPSLLKRVSKKLKKINRSDASEISDSLLFSKLMEEVLTHFKPEYAGLVDFLADLQTSSQFNLFNKALSIDDQRVKYEIPLDAFSDPDTAFPIFKKALSQQDSNVLRYRLKDLLNYNGKNVDQLFLLAFARSKPNPKPDEPYYNQSGLITDSIGTILYLYRGPEASKMLKEFLENKDPRVRSGAAIGVLGYTGDDSLDIFKKIIKKNDPNIYSAMKYFFNNSCDLFSGKTKAYEKSLMALHGEEIFELLYLNSDPKMRELAFDLLHCNFIINNKFASDKIDSYLSKAIKSEKAVEAGGRVREGILDGNSNLRIAALKALSSYKGRKNFDSEILEALDEPDPKVRIQAINSAVKYKTKHLEAILFKASQDQDSAVRSVVSSCLADDSIRKTVSPEKIQALLRKLLIDQDRNVNVNARSSLMRISQLDSGKMIKTLLKDSDLFIRIVVIGEIMNMNSVSNDLFAEVFDESEQLLLNSDPKVRRAAFEAIFFEHSFRHSHLEKIIELMSLAVSDPDQSLGVYFSSMINSGLVMYPDENVIFLDKVYHHSSRVGRLRLINDFSIFDSLNETIRSQWIKNAIQDHSKALRQAGFEKIESYKGGELSKLIKIGLLEGDINILKNIKKIFCKNYGSQTDFYLDQNEVLNDLVSDGDKRVRVNIVHLMDECPESEFYPIYSRLLLDEDEDVWRGVQKVMGNPHHDSRGDSYSQFKQNRESLHLSLLSDPHPLIKERAEAAIPKNPETSRRTHSSVTENSLNKDVEKVIEKLNGMNEIESIPRVKHQKSRNYSPCVIQ